MTIFSGILHLGLERNVRVEKEKGTGGVRRQCVWDILRHSDAFETATLG